MPPSMLSGLPPPMPPAVGMPPVPGMPPNMGGMPPPMGFPPMIPPFSMPPPGFPAFKPVRLLMISILFFYCFGFFFAIY